MATDLVLHTSPEAPLEAECLSPQRLSGLSQSEIEHLEVSHGNRKVRVGDFFNVNGRGSDEIHLEGELSHVKLVGTGMSGGRMTIDGNIGMHLGRALSGGQIVVNGDVSDWVGSEMSGGRITINGNAGHMVGSAYRGESSGIQGGEILIHGNVGNEVGGAMRRGLIAIEGNVGDFAGVNMLAGTVISFGQFGIRTGAGMKRGSIISFSSIEMLPTFSHNCIYRPLFLSLYLRYLRRLGFPVEDGYLKRRYRRWSGDAVELNRGEILVLDR